MLRFLADECFNKNIVAGLRRAREVDLVTVAEVRLLGRRDPEILAWAAAEARVVLSHDINTMIGLAYKRLEAGAEMAGVLIVPGRMPVGDAIAQLAVVHKTMDSQDFAGQVRYLRVHVSSQPP